MFAIELLFLRMRQRGGGRQSYLKSKREGRREEKLCGTKRREAGQAWHPEKEQAEDEGQKDKGPAWQTRSLQEAGKALGTDAHWPSEANCSDGATPSQAEGQRQGSLQIWQKSLTQLCLRLPHRKSLRCRVSQLSQRLEVNHDRGN